MSTKMEEFLYGGLRRLRYSYTDSCRKEQRLIRAKFGRELHFIRWLFLPVDVVQLPTLSRVAYISDMEYHKRSNIAHVYHSTIWRSDAFTHFFASFAYVVDMLLTI
jgi:hypothetical protein